MESDWKEVAGRVIGLGAPLLGQALGGPLGAAAGTILAQAIGAPEPTPGSVAATLTERGADTAIAADAVWRAETEWCAALAEVGKAQVAEVGQTMRAEIASDDLMQRWWRPVYALELSLVECPAFALTVLRALWLGQETSIAGFSTLSALLMAYFAARFGVLGVYVSGRSREKQAMITGDVPATLAAQVAGAVARAIGKGR